MRWWQFSRIDHPEGGTMTYNPTTEVLRRLPADLRCNPKAIEEHVLTLMDNGWSAQDVADAVSKETEPSHVVVRVRDLATVGGGTKPGRIRGSLGPCREGCDHGWINTTDHAVKPCPTCRPDTYHRLNKANRLRAAGADSHTVGEAMRDNPQAQPTTYPVAQ